MRIMLGQAYRNARELSGPPDRWYNRGVSDNPPSAVEAARDAMARGDHATAEALIRGAIAAQGGDDPSLLAWLGYVTRLRGDLDAASDAYVAALARCPGDAELHNNLAELRRAQGRAAEALALYRRAATLAPAKPEIPANIGSLLSALHRPDEALPYLEKALAMNPHLGTAHAEAALCLCGMNRFQDAISHYRALTRAVPADNNARYLEALALLALGDYENGWRKHECRHYASLGEGMRRRFPQPSWLGEDNLRGKTILLHAEQGMGDTIHFARYAPMVAARGARVIVEVHEPLQPLFARMRGVVAAYRRGDDLPAFDLHCSFMSLPRAFRTTWETIPAEMPYLDADPDRDAMWRNRIGRRGKRRRIAIAWSGTPTTWNRAIPLADLAPLLKRRDCEFHVAQTEIFDADRAVLDGLPHVKDHSADLKDFADTAALLVLMDQVITVDTVLAHLAGALARPVWTMLPLGPDYRWRDHGTTTPWYPTMTLFRQPALYDWGPVVAAVNAALGAAGP